MREITLNNMQRKVDLPQGHEELLRRCVGLICAEEGLPDQCEVGITFVDDEGIRLLNRDYRGIDESTDVLSFSVAGDAPGEPSVNAGYGLETELLLGDIIISAETACRQAQEYGHPLQRELAFLTVHGMLHLLGYDHQDEISEAQMFGKQRKILLGLEFQGGDER